LLEAGEKVKQETRGWNDAKGETTSQRSKEEAKDYRYMPEPDIPPIHLSTEFVETESAKLPLMPADYRKIFGKIIPSDTLEVLLDYPSLMESLGQLTQSEIRFSGRSGGYDRGGEGSEPRDDGSEEPRPRENVFRLRLAANLFTSVLLAEQKSAEYLNDLPSAKDLMELSEMNKKKELSSTATKEVFLRLFDPQMKGRGAKQIAKELGLIQENDLGALEAIVDTVLAKPETKQAQEDFKAGSEKVLGFLVGQVMKESHGKANPSAVQEILRKKLT
jgi:aspartyl-tRNA(Asn)/glutamyl-tRNA(Gln) amidotransferase subunit B